ncbi:MAG TPA: NAD(P)-dependent oxidoreductase [Candidatus Dormibacteraeota bacterium]|nr:NAD(P)-dependent oxidoreductase [Candidatus Dormibacteraeota bacterium]
MALLVSLVRGVVVLDRSVRAGAWDDHAAGPLPRLSDMRLGLIGFGRIGRAVARRARGLGIETRASDPLVPASEMIAEGVKPMALDELLRESTVISLHVPFTKEREHLIGERELRLLPQGSYLVNTARGQLVDTAALIAALESDQLAGAALDVLPAEPPTASHPIPTHPKLVVTPHAAWYSPKAEAEVVQKACTALSAVLNGEPAEGVIVPGI